MIRKTTLLGLCPALIPLLFAALPGRAQDAHKPPASPEARPNLIQTALEATPGGLTADEVVARAIETSPQLKSASLQAGKAEQNRARARLGFAPRVDLKAQLLRLSYVKMPAFGVDDEGNPQSLPQVLTQYSTQASLSLPITDFFLTVLPTYRGASLASDVAKYQRDAAELEVSYQARVAFYDYARAQGQLVVTEDAVSLLEAHVKDLTGLVSAGVTTQTDLMRAEAELADARAMRTQTQGAVEVTAIRLTQLVGSKIDPARGIGEPLVAESVEETPAMEGVLAKAYEERPELMALRTLGGVREQFERARKGAQWPQLRAFGNVYYAQPNPRVFPVREEFDATWDMGLMLSWSPNDYAYARIQATDATTDVAIVREDLRAMEEGVQIEAASAVTNHRAAREKLSSSMQRVEASRRRYADQRSLMLVGAATPNDVLEAENLLRRAELMWIDAFVQARMAYAALLKSQGQTGLATGSRSTP